MTLEKSLDFSLLNLKIGLMPSWLFMNHGCIKQVNVLNKLLYATSILAVCVDSTNPNIINVSFLQVPKPDIIPGL